MKQIAVVSVFQEDVVRVKENFNLEMKHLENPCVRAGMHLFIAQMLIICTVSSGAMTELITFYTLYVMIVR